jgi:hypothetical protein
VLPKTVAHRTSHVFAPTAKVSAQAKQTKIFLIVSQPSLIGYKKTEGKINASMDSFYASKQNIDTQIHHKKRK